MGTSKQGLSGSWIGLGLVLVGLSVAALSLGSVAIPIGAVLDILAGGGSDSVSGTWTTIVLELRLPRLLTSLLAGSSLAVAGAILQSYFRNPLAGPYVLGISAGAGLGVAISVLAAVPVAASWGRTGSIGSLLAATLGAGAVVGLLLLVSPRVSRITLLILGLLFGYAASALVTVLLHFAPDERLRGFLSWTFGSFADTGWDELGALGSTVVVGLAASMALAKSLDIVLLGAGEAESLGVHGGRLRLQVILVTALLTGVVTASCGPIGFIGIVVPHLARGIFGRMVHRRLLPACALVGAILGVAADLVARLPGSSSALPLNAVTALLGAPVVLIVVWRRRGLDA